MKSFRAPQAYNVVNAHAHEISRWTILSRLLHARALHLGGMNGDVQSNLAPLVFKNGEQLEGFHRILIRLQQENLQDRQGNVLAVEAGRGGSRRGGDRGRQRKEGTLVQENP